MATELKSLTQHVEKTMAHYSELSRSASVDPEYGLVGKAEAEAYYAEELDYDPTVVDLETNKADVEYQIEVATENLRHFETRYHKGELEPHKGEMDQDDLFRHIKSLKLRELSRLFLMRRLLAKMES